MSADQSPSKLDVDNKLRGINEMKSQSSSSSKSSSSSSQSSGSSSSSSSKSDVTDEEAEKRMLENILDSDSDSSG